jgi:uncharacterized protein YndB with AHSA1/START domain
MSPSTPESTPASVPSHTPQLLTDGDRPAVLVSRRLDHPAERVWEALTLPGLLARWFPSEAEFELRPGGTVTFDPDGESYDGQVLTAEPPRRLEFTWETDRLEFTLSGTREGDSTDLTLVHAFDDLAGAASFATGWEGCLAALADVLAGREPVDPGRRVARHEELVALFGLDRPEVTRGEDGTWRAAWERQLTRPAQAVWDLWFGTDGDTGRQQRAPEVGAPFQPYGAPDTVLGTVRAADEPREFALDIAEDVAGDTLRFRLGDGTGHGARIYLEVTGRDEDRDAALELWGEGALGALARAAAEQDAAAR